MASTTTPARACEIIRPTDLHALGMVRGELARTHALLGELDPADWLRPAECTGWSVRDVVAHMVGGNEELSRPVRLIRPCALAAPLSARDRKSERARWPLSSRSGMEKLYPCLFPIGIRSRQPCSPALRST
jgi:hypothetical protein